MPLPDPSRPDISYLQHSELFSGLDAATLTAIAQASRGRRVSRDEFFFQQHEPAVALYVLVEGRVKLTQVTPDGHRVILRVAAPGETFGTIAALGDARYPVWAHADGYCHALAWNSESTLDLMYRFPRLAINALRVLAITFGGFVAISNYLPKLLVDWYGFDRADAGLRAAGFTALATLCRPLGGVLADRFGGSNVLMTVFSAGPIGAPALAWVAASPRSCFPLCCFC